MHRSDKILVLGSNGMMGHTLFHYLNNFKNLKVFGLQRAKLKKPISSKIFVLKKINYQSLMKVIKELKPSFVINCIGVINHKIKKNDIDNVFFINSVLPQILSKISSIYNFKFIQISTDCVFSGKKGAYHEKSFPDGKDIYARSKLLGEVYGKNIITLRTSIFGHEVNTKFGLLEWFLNSKNEVNGYKNFFFTGITTLELSKIIQTCIIKKKTINHGLFHVGGKKMSKLNLLEVFNNVYSKRLKIVSVSRPKIDKSLKSTYFVKKTGYKFTSLKKMINEMKEFNEKLF